MRHDRAHLRPRESLTSRMACERVVDGGPWGRAENLSCVGVRGSLPGSVSSSTGYVRESVSSVPGSENSAPLPPQPLHPGAVRVGPHEIGASATVRQEVPRSVGKTQKYQYVSWCNRPRRHWQTIT